MNNLTVEQAFNNVVIICRQARLNADEHDTLVASLQMLKQLVDKSITTDTAAVEVKS